jgi:hypothetical protein
VASTRQRFVFAGVAAILAVALVEVAAIALLSLRGGALSTPSLRRAARDAVASASSSEANLPSPEGGSRRPRDRGVRSLGVVLHPYLGFVHDPAAENPYWSVGPEGFYTNPNAPPSPAHRVLVLGGSLANQFALVGAPALRARLAQRFQIAPQAIGITARTMGGYKQPQALVALASELAQGRRYDAIVLLDGFNDLVLPFDNLAAGLAPEYPFNWKQLVGGLPDLDAQLLGGELRYLRRLRQERAHLCERPLVNALASCHVVWRALDAPLGRRVAALERALAERSSGRASFESSGPSRAPLEQAQQLAANVALWQRASLEMASLAATWGTPYLHCLQPNQYLPGSKPMGPAERALAFNPTKSHRPIVETGYPLLRQAGAELATQGVGFCDLTQVFAAVEEPLYNDDCCHLNSRGYERLGEVVGDLLADRIAQPVVHPQGLGARSAAPTDDPG